MTFKMKNRKITTKKSALEKAFGQDDDTDEAVAAEVKKQMERAGRQTRWTIGRQVHASEFRTYQQYRHAHTIVRMHVDYGKHPNGSRTPKIYKQKHKLGLKAKHIPSQNYADTQPRM